jgi:sialate O-acetylesterase
VGSPEEMFIKTADSVIPLAGNWFFKKTFELSQVSPVPQEGLPNAFLISSLYNGMIDPLKRYAVKGFLWYQGEANISNSSQYPLMLSNLAGGWRNAWGVDLPFYYVQIAPWSYSGHTNTEAAQMRSIMSDSCKSISNSAVVLTGDLGDSLNIHPSKKREVGERLALKALSKTYGIKKYDIDYPVVKSAKKEGFKVVLIIEETYGQIIVNPGANTFEMSEDGINYFKSSFEIRGNKIILQCDKVKSPKFVRHAFRNSSKVNVLNAKMLPLNLFTITLKN